MPGWSSSGPGQWWGGSLAEEATLAATPALVTVAPHAVEAAVSDGSPAPAVQSFAPEHQVVPAIGAETRRVRGG